MRTLACFSFVLLLAAPPALADVFVGDASDEGAILSFSELQDGNVPPIREITGPATKLDTPNGVTVDRKNGEIYVADFFGQAVRVFSITGNGNISPIRELVDGPNSGLGQVRSVAIDLEHDELFALSIDDTIRIYPRTANGDIAPVRQITGVLTQLSNPGSIDYDPIHEEIIVSSAATGGGAILIFPRNVLGNSAPSRVISGANTDVGYDSSYDGANDEIVSAGSDGSIVVHPRTANGNVAPIRKISGAATGLRVIFDVHVDPWTDIIWVSQVRDVRGGGPPDPAVLAFDRTAIGNVAPLGFFFGNLTGLSSPNGVTTEVSVIFADGFESNGTGVWPHAQP